MTKQTKEDWPSYIGRILGVIFVVYMVIWVIIILTWLTGRLLTTTGIF